MKQPLIFQPCLLDVTYARGHELQGILTDPTVLAVIVMGDSIPQDNDPRCVHIPLQPIGPAMLEVWRCKSGVQTGRFGDVIWSSDGQLLFGKMELAESSLGLERCTEDIYQQISNTLQRFAMPCLLRIWNTLDAICEGPGDQERYRRFCIGRARGMRFFSPTHLPAATAVGRQDGHRVIQVYWLASRFPGHPVENPRQTSAYHYPRNYGPRPPLFARAMAAPATVPLLISGTAAVVGHASMHHNNITAQLDEIMRNFRALLQETHRRFPDISPWFTRRSLIKVYLDDVTWGSRIDQILARLLPETPRVLLAATICRKNLLLEIEGVHW